MKSKTKKNFRLVVDFSEKAVVRVRFGERDRNSKYVPIERPWGAKELAGLKLVTKVANLTSRGVADLEEVCRTASAPRRRKLGKKLPVEDAAVHTGNRTDRRQNGLDEEVARST
jgi:uncharacterized protein related to proFAR isomerase